MKLPLKFVSIPALKRLAILFATISALAFPAHYTMIGMPGNSYTGPLPPLTDTQRALADELETDVRYLVEKFTPRSVGWAENLAGAADRLDSTLNEMGLNVSRQSYTVAGVTCENIIAELPGSTHPEEIIIVGAHYDGVYDQPGANDNGSGVAATLALARMFADRQPARTLRFVCFVNEEPPHFQTQDMGSLVYARRCKAEQENIVAMISLETIGYYTDAPDSQKYPVPLGWLYPTTGDFIAFVGNFSSRGLVKEAIGTFREHAKFPSEGAALPATIPGVGWSDHWAFWQIDCPAIMITDTAPFRYPHYHTMQDTPEKIDYERMARVVEGMNMVVEELARPSGE